MGSLDLLSGALGRAGSQGRDRRQKDEEPRVEQTGGRGDTEGPRRSGLGRKRKAEKQEKEPKKGVERSESRKSVVGRWEGRTQRRARADSTVGPGRLQA